MALFAGLCFAFIMQAQNSGVRECPEWQPCSKEEIEQRFALISSDIPMEMNSTVYTHIRHCLHRSKEKSERLIGLCETYFPVIDEVLQQEGVPIALKYMCIAESNMNPTAISRAEAVGMWQFMEYTGKMYGLTTNEFVDERYDFYKETRAAARFLRDLHDQFDDWLLAIAAYNCGPGRVRKAIRRSGGKKDFWKIKRFLPRETRNYVPRILAETYFMYYYSEYDLRPVDPYWKDLYVAIEEVHYDTHPESIANKHGVTLGELYLFNPELLKNKIEMLDLPYYAKIPAPYNHYEMGIAQAYVPEEGAASIQKGRNYPRTTIVPDKLAVVEASDLPIETEKEEPFTESLFEEQMKRMDLEREALNAEIATQKKKGFFPFLGKIFSR